MALDLGVRSGFAIGPAGACPRSGAVALKRPDEHRSVAGSNLIAFLAETFEAERPALVVKEAPFPLQAFKDRGNAEKTVRLTYGLHMIVEAMCARFALRWYEEHPNTIRKHFIGTGRGKGRADTKAAVVARAKLLRLIPVDCEDDDRADACAIHDWASATFAGRVPSELHLFGERA